MNISSTKAPTNSYTLTIKLPKFSGKQANDTVWTGVDKVETTGASAMALADPGLGFTGTVKRTLKFGTVSAIPGMGLKFGKQVKAGLDSGQITSSEKTHWANAAVGAGQLAGIGLGIAAAGSLLTGIGSASALGIASAVGFGAAAVGGMVLANTADPDQLSINFVQQKS